MIVVVSKLQRTILYKGIDYTTKLSVDTTGALKRLNRSTREAESVTNLVGALKSQLDNIPSSEQDGVAVEIATEVADTVLTVLSMYTRNVTLLERRVANHPELGGIRSANSCEDAANKLAEQLQEQLNLPIQTLESIVAGQDAREKKEKEEAPEYTGKDPGTQDPTDPAFEGVHAAPHRGVGKKAAKTVEPTSPMTEKAKKTKWNREHRKAKKDGKGAEE